MESVKKIIKIGNSDGIILTKKMMYYAQLNEVLYLKAKVEKGRIVLTKTVKSPKKK